MIQTFVDRFMENKDDIRAEIAKAHIRSYDELVRIVIENITDDDDDDDDGHNPDPSRIHCIDDGDYQGTLVFIIAAKGYHPNRYWATKVYYGSCSACDTLQRIAGYSDQPPTIEQIEDYMSLALHIVQGLVEI